MCVSFAAASCHHLKNSSSSFVAIPFVLQTLFLDYGDVISSQLHGNPIPKKPPVLRSLSKKKTPTCYRCDDRGHIASSCRNALVCFSCMKVGHRSHSCKATTTRSPSTFPSPSRPQMATLNSHPPVKFFSNHENCKFREVLDRGIVLFDQQDRGDVHSVTPH